MNDIIAMHRADLVDAVTIAVQPLKGEIDKLKAENVKLKDARVLGAIASATLRDESLAHQIENRELREKVAFLESREVCAAAHDNVETCGYCQRDALAKQVYELESALAFWMPDEGFIPPEWKAEWDKHIELLPPAPDRIGAVLARPQAKISDATRTHNWTCEKCGQCNTWWAIDCGRCSAARKVTALQRTGEPRG